MASSAQKTTSSELKCKSNSKSLNEAVEQPSQNSETVAVTGPVSATTFVSSNFQQSLPTLPPNQFGQIFGLNYFNAMPPHPPVNQHSASISQIFSHPNLLDGVGPSSIGSAAPASASSVSNMSPNQCITMLTSNQIDPRLVMEIGKDDLEVKAKDHREAASRVNECENVYSINSFDFKPPSDAIYSTKVFLGGVPWEMNNDDMMEVFRPFGVESIQRPGKEVRLSRSSQGLDKAGYLYLLFNTEAGVNKLIDACKLEFSETGHKYYYNVLSKKSKKEKRVQVIPWNTADSCEVVNPQAKSDLSRTVFLGALHGMMSASSIAKALTLIFGPVEFVVIDTDRCKYPSGSGKAMFATRTAFKKAIKAGFVRIKSDRFEKTVKIFNEFIEWIYLNSFFNL